MKKIIITKAQKMNGVGKDDQPQFGSESQDGSYLIPIECFGEEDMDASDGFHTFTELYDHRIALFIALCKKIHEESSSCDYPSEVWRSKLHSDGSAFDGWFVMGIGKEKGKQITYHLPMAVWGDTDFVMTLEKAPEFDGHSSADVLQRIRKI